MKNKETMNDFDCEISSGESVLELLESTNMIEKLQKISLEFGSELEKLNDTFDKIPMIKQMYAIGKGAISFSDAILFIRFHLFVKSFESGYYSEAQRKCYYGKLKSPDRQCRRLIGNLLQDFQRLDDNAKISYYGILLAAYFDKKVNLQEYQHFVRILGVLFLEDIPWLRFCVENNEIVAKISEVGAQNAPQKHEISPEQGGRLQSIGLAYPSYMSLLGAPSEVTYLATEAGARLLEIFDFYMDSSEKVDE